MRILILGAGGMLGHTLFYEFSRRPDWTVWGTARQRQPLLSRLPAGLHPFLLETGDASDPLSWLTVFNTVRPQVVINCIGIIKQSAASHDPLTALPVNALFPHQMLRLCQLAQARLIHISTDCVFSGHKGLYKEEDQPDARDLYGLSKYLGEVVRSPEALTLRTSIIGHELKPGLSLLEWFLARQGEVRGFRKAVFSGFPTCELAHIIAEQVLPDPRLWGLYHLSGDPISKYDLLTLVAAQYGCPVTIVPDERAAGDRSLDSTRFREATGYQPPAWPLMIKNMYLQNQRFRGELP